MTDAERLRKQYQDSLGRAASDAEIAGWTSGRFGGGGVADWERQIAGSHEAQQRAPARAPLSQQAAPGAGYPPASAPQPKTDPYAKFLQSDRSRGAADQVLKNAYTDFLGRDADDAGLQSHFQNPLGTEGAVKSIYDSPEAQAYRRNQATAPTPTDPAATTPAAAAAVQPSVFQGFTPKHAMEGFDFNREQNTGKSAKDAFAFLSNNSPPPPIEDKARLGAWFKQYVEPGMNQLGHKVLSVEGDKFTFENWQGRFTVDFGRGAGAQGGALAWQVDPGTAVMGNGPYVPQQSAPKKPVVNTDTELPELPETFFIDPRTGQQQPWDPNDPTFRGNVMVDGKLMSDDLARQTLGDLTQYRRRPYQRFTPASGGDGNNYSAPQPSI